MTTRSTGTPAMAGPPSLKMASAATSVATRARTRPWWREPARRAPAFRGGRAGSTPSLYTIPAAASRGRALVAGSQVEDGTACVGSMANGSLMVRWDTSNSTTGGSVDLAPFPLSIEKLHL